MHDFHESFTSELQLLSERAQEFAASYPEHIDLLTDQNDFIKNFSFISAQLKARINDDVPELAETLLRTKYPSVLQPLPAMLVGQFQACDFSTRTIEKICANTQVINGKFQFKTIVELSLLPINVSKVKVVNSKPGNVTLTLTFETPQNFDIMSVRSIPLYLNLNRALALQLSFELQECLQQSTIKWFSKDGTEACTHDALTIRTNYKNNSTGFSILQEYFAYNNKFNFIDIIFSEKIEERSMYITGFCVELEIQTESSLYSQLSKNTFLLNCTPLVNLWEMSAEPILLTHYKHEYPLIADHGDLSINIQDMNMAEGIRGDGTRVPYKRFCNNYRKDEKYFSFTTKNMGYNQQAYVTVTENNDTVKETLSCSITANNGNCSRDYLPKYSTSWHCGELENKIKLINVTKPTKYLEPIKREQYLLKILEVLHANIDTSLNKDDLCNILTQCDWTKNSDNKQRRQAIRSVSSSTRIVVQQGKIIQQYEIKISLDEKCFLNIGDLYSFAGALHMFFEKHVPINFFTKTIVECFPSEQRYTWSEYVN